MSIQMTPYCVLVKVYHILYWTRLAIVLRKLVKVNTTSKLSLHRVLLRFLTYIQTWSYGNEPLSYNAAYLRTSRPA